VVDYFFHLIGWGGGEHFGLLNVKDGVPFELWNVKGETFGLWTVLTDRLLKYGM